MLQIVSLRVWQFLNFSTNTYHPKEKLNYIQSILHSIPSNGSMDGFDLKKKMSQNKPIQLIQISVLNPSIIEMFEICIKLYTPISLSI